MEDKVWQLGIDNELRLAYKHMQFSKKEVRMLKRLSTSISRNQLKLCQDNNEDVKMVDLRLASGIISITEGLLQNISEADYIALEEDVDKTKRFIEVLLFLLLQITDENESEKGELADTSESSEFPEDYSGQ